VLEITWVNGGMEGVSRSKAALRPADKNAMSTSSTEVVIVLETAVDGLAPPRKRELCGLS
jgi:hypothetical protein